MIRALIVLALIAGAARADGPRTIAIGFDHNLHARDVEVSSGAPIACAHCHDEKAGRLVGRPGHAACFGTCHGPAPTTPKRGAKLALDDAHLRLCTNCHAESALLAPYTGTLTVGYPPYRIDRDFSLALGHKQHRDAPCVQCHDPITKKPPVPTPHVRCIGCHDGSTTKGHAFAMATCAPCHPQAVGNPQPPELETLQNTVTSIFSHATHAARGGAGKDCTTCHAKIRDADETHIELPRPTADDCERCHDGKQAFGVTVACTRCHDEPKQPFKVIRPTARFRHDGHHEQLVAGEACTTCHLLDVKTGEITIAGHAVCTSCHHDDFGARKPKKCGACHNATEPWRHLRADRGLPDTTEFGASLDHAKHPAACASCHSLHTATTQLRTPRGHTSCVGGACHAATGGPAPHLSECTACHVLGLAAARLAKTTGAAWSVRVAFDHAPHAKDPNGAPIACQACHTSLEGQLVALPTPAKATCATCHDGARAFKLTGTTCRRCHKGSK